MGTEAGFSHASVCSAPCPSPAAAVGSLAVSEGAVLALEPPFPVFNTLPLVLLTTSGDFVFWMICSRRRLVGSNPVKHGTAVASLVFSAQASQYMN